MSPATIGAVAAAVGVTLFFASLRAISPAPPALAGAVSPEELEARYGRWPLYELLALLVLAPLAAGLWYLVFRLLETAALPARPAVGFVVVPSPAYWMIPSLFLGIVSAGIAMLRLERAILKEKVAEKALYERQRTGIALDPQKAFRVLAVVIVPLAFGAVVLGLDCHGRFDAGGIVLNRALSLGETSYRYDEVKSVRLHVDAKAPAGNLVRLASPQLVIVFRDGTHWSTKSALRDPSPDDAELARFVAERSGRELALGYLLLADLSDPVLDHVGRGFAAREKGDDGATESELRAALALMDATPGLNDALLGATLSELGRIEHHRKKLDEAEALYRRSLAATESALGPEHFDVSAVVNNLAMVVEDRGRAEEADALFRRAIAVREKAVGAEHESMSAVLGNYAAFLRGQGQGAAAERLAARAEKLRKK